MIIPEIQIKKIIDYVLKKVWTEDRYIYEVFNSIKLNEWNFVENGKKLFDQSPKNPNRVESFLFFNQNRAGLPTIHIVLPGEMPGGDLGLGFDRGESLGNCDSELVVKTQSRIFTAKYGIVFTSQNTLETIIMYNLFKSFFIGNDSLLHLNGISNVKISGNDIILEQDLIPANIYSRTLNIEFIYEVEGFSLNNEDKSFTTIEFNGESVIDN